MSSTNTENTQLLAIKWLSAIDCWQSVITYQIIIMKVKVSPDCCREKKFIRLQKKIFIHTSVWMSNFWSLCKRYMCTYIDIIRISNTNTATVAWRRIIHKKKGTEKSSEGLELISDRRILRDTVRAIPRPYRDITRGHSISRFAFHPITFLCTLFYYYYYYYYFLFLSNIFATLRAVIDNVRNYIRPGSFPLFTERPANKIEEKTNRRDLYGRMKIFFGVSYDAAAAGHF